MPRKGTLEVAAPEPRLCDLGERLGDLFHLFRRREHNEVVGLLVEDPPAEEDAVQAWDALHRCLSDGTLDVTGGEPPLNDVAPFLRGAGERRVLLNAW